MRGSRSAGAPMYMSRGRAARRSRRAGTADGLAADAAHDLADEEAEGKRVVARVRARLPRGRHCSSGADDALPVEEVVGRTSPSGTGAIPDWCVIRW